MRVSIRRECSDWPRSGTVVGPVFGELTPVLWDGQSVPDYFRTKWIEEVKLGSTNPGVVASVYQSMADLAQHLMCWAVANEGHESQSDILQIHDRLMAIVRRGD